MAAPRAAIRVIRQATAQPFTSLSSSFSSPWRCPQCSRTFASSRPYRDTSRRHLQTATAYQPSNIPSHTFPQAPRNSDVPSTSIAGDTPSANEPQPSRSTEQRSSVSGSSLDTGTITNMTEHEAQKTKVVTPPPATPSSPSGSTRPKRSKLRARKAAMTLTPTAVEQLRNLLDQPDPKLIRVGVKNRGCSGLAYHLEYVDKPGMFDEAVEQDGVKVLVDSKALFSIIGSEMDWLEDKLSARFVFKNPNITEQCGCGESFSIG